MLDIQIYINDYYKVLLKHSKKLEELSNNLVKITYICKRFMQNPSVKSNLF